MNELSQNHNSDSDLLSSFAKQRDEAAFAQLVSRHGALVLGVCRRVLHEGADVEDAFQAVFMILARDARKIRNPEALASWLYGVAFRTAMRVNQQRHRRKEVPLVEVAATEKNILEQVAQQHERQLLDEELCQLPEKYRSPLILHYLAGQTAEQIAKSMKLTASAVEGRLRRARRELRARLARRGVSLAVLFFAATSAAAARQGLQLASEGLIATTVQAAIAFTSSAGSAAATSLSSQTVSLAGKEVTIMLNLAASTKVAIACSALLAVGVLGLAGTLPIAEGQTGNVVLIDRGGNAHSSGAASGNSASVPVNRFRNEAEEGAADDAFELAGEEGQATGGVSGGLAGSGLIGPDPAIGVKGGVPANNATGAGPGEMGAGVADAGPQVTVSTSASDTEKKIQAELENKTKIEFLEAPLADVAQFIGDLHNINVTFDEAALEGEGIDTSLPISSALKDVELRDALDLMLLPRELDYVVKNNVLMITTKQKADAYLEVRIYDLSHFKGVSAHEIQTVLGSTLSTPPVSVGGFGPFPPGAETPPQSGTIATLGKSLIIRDNQRAHQEIQKVLELLDRHAKTNPDAFQSEDGNGEEGLGIGGFGGRLGG